MSNFRTALLSTAAAGLMAVAVAPASAGEVEKSLGVSGHVNRAVYVADNGENSALSQTDNGVSGSRFRIVGSAKSESMTIGTTLELSAQSSGAAAHADNQNTDSHGIRVSAISVKNDMGTLYLGRHYAVTTGVYDQSGSSALDGLAADGSFVGGAEQFLTDGDTSTATSTNPTISDVFGAYSSIMGTRDNVIRYDSPDMSGFSAKASYGAATQGAVSGHYSGDFDGVKVTAAVGYQGGGNTASREDSWGGGISVKLAGGFNGAVNYAKRDSDEGSNLEREQFGANIGYAMGANAISLVYLASDDRVTDGDDATMWGVNVQHRLADYGTSIYGGIANAEYDDATATNYDDITTGWVGIKVSF